jgi:hypothetical protein
MFRNVLHTPDRNARQIHLNQRFLDRALAPPIALNNSRLEGLATQLGDLEVDFADAGLQ